MLPVVNCATAVPTMSAGVVMAKSPEPIWELSPSAWPKRDGRGEPGLEPAPATPGNARSRPW